MSTVALVLRRAALLQQRKPSWTACMCIARAAEGLPDPGISWSAAHLFFSDLFRPMHLKPTATWWAIPPRRQAERVMALWLAMLVAKDKGL